MALIRCGAGTKGELVVLNQSTDTTIITVNPDGRESFYYSQQSSSVETPTVTNGTLGTRLENGAGCSLWVVNVTDPSQNVIFTTSISKFQSAYAID